MIHIIREQRIPQRSRASGLFSGENALTENQHASLALKMNISLHPLEKWEYIVRCCVRKGCHTASSLKSWFVSPEGEWHPCHATCSSEPEVNMEFHRQVCGSKSNMRHAKVVKGWRNLSLESDGSPPSSPSIKVLERTPCLTSASGQHVHTNVSPCFTYLNPFILLLCFKHH